MEEVEELDVETDAIVLTDDERKPASQNDTMSQASVTSESVQLQSHAQTPMYSTFNVMLRIAELDERIESVERGVITSEQDNSKEKEVSIEKENDITNEVEVILKEWTVKIQDRYKSVGDLEEVVVHNMILKAIKTQANNKVKVHLTKAVDEELQGKINQLESTKMDILNEVLKKAGENIGLGSAAAQVGNTETKKIIKAISPWLDLKKDKEKLKELTDTEKKILIDYKTAEFLKLQSLVADTDLETLNSSDPKSIEKVSEELQKYCSEGTKSERIESEKFQLEEEYTQLCDEKITAIFNESDILEKRFGLSIEFKHLIMSMIIGLEKFSSNNFDRHKFYDQIWLQLSGLTKADCIEAIRSELESIKETVLSEQWENFAQGKAKTTDQVVGILEAYCRSKDIPVSMEELEYHLDNMIEPEEVYAAIQTKLISQVDQNKLTSDKMHLLKSFILSKVDQIKLNKITELFEVRLNYQEEQHERVLEMKKNITKEFCRYCTILDKVKKENYAAIMKLYLDRLDRLVAEKNAEDISYLKRKEIFHTLKQSIADIIKNSALKDDTKAEHIEMKISETLSELVFATSCTLSVDILKHLNLETIVDVSLETQSEYKRKTKTVQAIKLEDLFDNSGRVKENEGNEIFFKNKTVIANIDREEYYRLSEDISSLMGNPATYRISVEEYRKELSTQYKKYKLEHLRSAIITYNSNKSMKNLLDITQGLIYYLALREEHLQSERTFEEAIQEFLKSYHNTMKHLMINNKHDQVVISELRIAIDLFKEDVMHQRGIITVDDTTEKAKLNAGALVSTLIALRNTLIYKTYKESEFKSFTEEENQFQGQLAQNNFLQRNLNEISQEKIPELIWLRGIIMPLNPEDFFESLNKLASENLTEQLAETTKDSIVSIQKFINQEKNKIVLNGLVDDEALDGVEDKVEGFIKKVRTKELSWEVVLSNPKLEDQHKFQKLNLIVQEHHEKFSADDLEGLIIQLCDKEASVDLDALSMSALRVYASKILADKKNGLEATRKEKEQITELLGIRLLEVAIIRAFNVWQIVVESAQPKKCHDFINYLKQLVNCICIPEMACLEDNIIVIENALEQTQIRFITDIPKPELASTNTENNIPVLLNFPNTDQDVITNLELLLQLPDTFYNKEKNCKGFIQQLVSLCDKFKQSHEIHYYARELVCRCLDTILNITEDISEKASNIHEEFRRLYSNIPVSDFIKYTRTWLQAKDKEGEEDFVTKKGQIHQENINEMDISFILQLLYSEEKQHLRAFLSFGTTGKTEAISDWKKEENSKALDEVIVKLLQKNKHDTSNAISKLKEIFTGDNRPPIIMWREELIDLRLNAVRDLILSKMSKDHGTNKISDILNAFRFFHDKNGIIGDALDTLELICKNINKFSTLEEIKQFIFLLLHIKDLTAVNHMIEFSDKQNITLDLIFSQIDAGYDLRLKNAIDKLKFILSYRTFEEINDFCRIFVLQVREEQNLDNLYIIIDLIINSKAYINQDFLRELQDKDISLWRRFLEKAIILNELNTTAFNVCRNKDKDKTVDLLHQIKQEKGENLQKMLFEKMKNLDTADKYSANIKKLNLILNKMIFKQYKCEAVENLSPKLMDWEKILFLNDESSEVLSIKQLLDIMKEGGKIDSDGINASIKFCLQNAIDGKEETMIERLLQESRNLNKQSKIHKQSKNINEWQEQDIREWAKSFKSSSKCNKMFFWRTAASTEVISEVMSVIIRAVTIYDHYPKGPRDTQLMSLLLFLDNNKKGRLGNVYTGEGKTMITVMLATCLGLIGKKVDIVTSSKVLAVRDSKARESETKEGYAGFFQMFDLKASNNCDEECDKAETGEEERKKRYESCSIIYGETSYFQRDILLSQFFRKDIRRGNGIGDALILDEVDSMMIDNAAKTLYISHNITDMRHLRDVFIHIWAAVNSQQERYYSEENVKKIIEYINKITVNVEKQNSVQEDCLKILIPSTLYAFVQLNLKTWIESAYNAKYINEDNAYIIGDADSQKQNEVIIMDKDTGVEQTSTKWSNGLHQFIQLKHSGNLSDESLKAVYISNAGYFQNYPNLYGMTGTVGGIEERKLLSDVYGIDFFEMPRFKAYRFEYDFESESVANTSEEWLQNIIVNIDENMDQQLAYTQEYISLMQEKLKTETISLQKLTEDYEKRSSEKKALDLQYAQCKQKRDIYEALERTTQRIIKICVNPVLIKFQAEMKIIAEEISKLPKSCTDSNPLHQLIQNFITNVSGSESDYGIEQSGITFAKDVKKIASNADLIGKEKEELERLTMLIKKIQEDIDYTDVEKTKCHRDVTFYQSESKAEVKSQRPDSRRAVLIICDNIADLKCIEVKVRNHFNNPDKFKIYKYDRAYKSFGISCLQAGDIVIATNIAGRGTDLQVSKQVEENGGLHVILSYMPNNFRIEKQAFGRTARGGNKGTATYIVFDVRKQSEDIDVSQLKKERNERETSRLVVVQKEQLPKIKLEDELFVEFNKLQQSVESKLKSKYKSKDLIRLQIDSLKNKWAFWLNEMSENFDKVHETGNTVILKEYEVFKTEINNKLYNKYELIDEPGELNKLGRVYLDNSQYSEALECFNYVIEKHSSFASIALYYKAVCIIRIEGGGFDAKVKAKTALKTSLRMLEDNRSRILSRNQILQTINEVARARGKGLESNYFAKQNEGEAQILSVHINSINSALGSEVSPDSFNASGIIGDQSQKVFNELIKDKYDIIKNFRVSKKCVISEGQIFRKVNMNNNAVANTEILPFPDVFHYCKDKVLYDLEQSLINSKNKSWSYKERIKTSSSFESVIYTKQKFVQDTKELIKVEKMIRISEDVKQKLLGKLDHQVFCSQGHQIKNILTGKLLNIDYKFLEPAFSDVKNESIFFGKKAEIKDFCLGRAKITLSDNKIAELLDNQSFSQDKLVEALKCIIKLPEPSSADRTTFDALLVQLGFDVGSNIIPKHQLVQVVKDNTALQGDQINKILTHLEVYTQLSIDHNFLKQRFTDVKNEAIFFGKKAEIRDFCLGRKKISLKEDQIIELLDNQIFAKDKIVDTLRKIIKLPEHPSSADNTNFDALLIQLGFDAGIQFEAITSYNQYSFKDVTHVTKIKEYLEVINLKDCSNDKDTIGKLDQLNFSVDSRLAKKSGKLIHMLKHNLSIDKALKKADFELVEESFDILRAILNDANIITTSIFNMLMGGGKKEILNQELDTILMRMYQANGVITDRDIVLKDAKQGSQELFNRMRELNIIKPPKVHFTLGRAKNVPEFLGGNARKNDSDPLKRMEYIKSKIEKVVQEVFRLERQSDSWHTVNEYVTGGIGTESKNKELDEKIETITNIIKHSAGTIKTLPEIKVELKDLRTMFGGGKVPPELMDYIHICFEAVLEYKEDKRFDWDCFLCAMVGLAQIVAGITLEVMSGGSAHFIAQALIAEGIGDIVFAIQASVEGNFSWKSYGQHKVQSLMLTLVTAGVGSFLSKGAQAGKMAVGLATKTAITKAVMKTVVVEACTAVVTASVNVGTEEICKLVIEEIANIHFVQYFEKWTKEDSAYRQNTISIEDKLNSLYNKYGSTIAKQNIESCIESSLNQIISGSLGNKIFTQVSCVVGSITMGFSTAANRLGKGNSKAKILGTIASIVQKTVKVAEFSKNFLQLCTICNDFYNHLAVELEKVDQNLMEQQKNGTLKIDEIQIAQEKVECSFSGEASKDLRNAQEKMHIAFQQKIKNGFLQPAIGSLLRMAVKPIHQTLTSPFVDAMEDLKDHIDSRSEMFQKAIMNQNTESVVKITSRQKKALEARGEIIKIEHIQNPNILQADVANFEGETLENLYKEHGNNLNVMIKDGRIYVVLPTYKQFCNNIQDGNLQLAGTLHIKMAATQARRNIEIVSLDIDGSNTVIHHERGPGSVAPAINSTPGEESYKIAFIDGGEGEYGHYVPVIKDKNGNWKVITDISQTTKIKDACFGQTMAFLKEYEKTGDLEGAKIHAATPKAVSEYNKLLGKFAVCNKSIKTLYHEGTTVRSNRIVGGTESTIHRLDRKLKEMESVLSSKIKDIVAQIKKAPNKSSKNLLYTVLANELFHEVPHLSEEYQKEIHLLAAQYNDNISVISPYTMEFSQDKINAFFSSDHTKTGFPHAGKSVQEVGRLIPFPADDFLIEVFHHPDKKGVLVINNNRGATAHAIAGVPITRIKLIDYDSASNKSAFLKRKGDGTTIQFDKNSSSTRKILMNKITREFKRLTTSIQNSRLTDRVDRQSSDRSSGPGLQGTNLNRSTNIGRINSYFSKYTLSAIQNILELRINNSGIKNVIIPRGYIFEENYNNLQRMISDLTDAKSQVILAPLNLFNKHAVGIMCVKDQDNNFKVYYSDPSNESIPDELKQIFVDNGVQVVQLPAIQQMYTNCGPEVIENFMLYLTGERLSQEESIAYHSKLVEQKLVQPHI